MKTSRAGSTLFLPLALLVAVLAQGCGGEVTVSIIPRTANTTPGGTVPFTAVVTGTSDTSVTWSVPAGESAGSISQEGIYTAPSAPGTYQVKATSSSEPRKSATAEVVVQANVAITLTPSPITMSTRASQTFTAMVTGTPERGVTWTIEEGSAGGTITEDGTYTAPASPGSYHVVATSKADTTKSAKATVTVTSDFVASVIIDPAQPTVVTGQFLPFAAEVQGVFYSASIDWSVLGSGGGGITRSGVYLAPNTPGIYYVVAASAEDASKRALATVEVKGPQGVSLSLTPRIVEVFWGSKQTFSASVSGASNKQVTWSVLESNGGTITQDGLYTAPFTSGRYTIVATSHADTTKSAQALVQVTNIRTPSLAINPSTIRLSPGGVTTFTGIASGGVYYASDIQWRVLEGSAGGTVNAQGAYVAPTTPGVYHVAAELPWTEVNVFSTVTVE
jgi:hypothetical protein